jgi:hypothetical protein
MRRTEIVIETSVSFIQLTRLIALYHIPDDEGRNSPRNVGFIYTSNAGDCPYIFYDEVRDSPRNVGFIYTSDAADCPVHF